MTNIQPGKLTQLASDPERRAKLPQWAREHMERIERENEGLHAKLAAVEKRATDDSKVYLRRFDGRIGDLELPEDSTVVFKLGPKFCDVIEVTLERNREQKPVGIWVRGGLSLQIIPQASNVILAKNADR